MSLCCGMDPERDRMAHEQKRRPAKTRRCGLKERDKSAWLEMECARLRQQRLQQRGSGALPKALRPKAAA